MKINITYIDMGKSERISRDQHDKIVMEMLMAGEIKPIRVEVIYE